MASSGKQYVEMQLDPKHDSYDFPTKAAQPREGHPGCLTEQQMAQVHQLRSMLEGEGYTQRLDTLTLLRFLRARKFDVNLAQKMFVDCEKWRKDTKLDETVPTWDYPEKEELFKYYPQFYHKSDIDGRPVYIEQMGGIDLTAMYKITTPERMLTNLAVEYERLADPRLPAASRKAGALLETCCTIMDFKGVGITKIPKVYSFINQVSAMSQNYYPERLGRMYLINTPWGFSGIWSVVKGWLDPVTVEKIHVLGSGYKSDLLKQVPAENLPKAVGGTCECPGGCQFSNAGPWQEKEWARPAKWETTGAGSAKAAEAAAESNANNSGAGASTEVPPAYTGGEEIGTATTTDPAPAAA